MTSVCPHCINLSCVFFSTDKDHGDGEENERPDTLHPLLGIVSLVIVFCSHLPSKDPRQMLWLKWFRYSWCKERGEHEGETAQSYVVGAGKATVFVSVCIYVFVAVFESVFVC